LSIIFPNPSRIFEEADHYIRFWGYDGILQIEFAIESDALKKLCPECDGTAPSTLEAFDKSRSRVYESAEALYIKAKKRASIYMLKAGDV
jgi:hypothetical protein